MQLFLRRFNLFLCLLVLGACSSGPQPGPLVAEPTLHPPLLPGEPSATGYVQPITVVAQHDWLQRRYLQAHIHEAASLAVNSVAEVEADRSFMPVLVLESQSHLLYIAPGARGQDYQPAIAAYTELRPEQTVIWSNEPALAQFSFMLPWDTAQLIGQIDLDYPLLQASLTTYLHTSLNEFPDAYELAVSLVYESQTQASALIIEGATQLTYQAQLQARLLSALYALPSAAREDLAPYARQLIMPAMVAADGPLLRFILVPKEV